MYRRALVGILSALTLMVGSAVGQVTSQPATDMLVQADWLAANLKTPELVILQVGADQATYDAAHIPGARFLAWSDITTTRNGVPNQLPAANELKAVFERAGLGDASRVVLYAADPLQSAYAYFALDYLGHGRHAILDGGWAKWNSEKLPTTSAKPEVKTATLTVQPHPDLLVDLPAVQKIVTAKNMPLIDGRPPEQYSGVKPGDGIKRAGHIPGAHNVFWMDTLVSKENPVLKPVADIRAMYAAAGAKAGDTVLVYCRTGLIATHEYFTLKLAGFRPVRYGGSFMEWSNATGTPVEPGS